MKRLIIGAVIAIAIISACARIGGAQSSQPTTLNAAAIPAGKVIAIQLDTPLSTCFTKKGENVAFHTTADVVVDNQILIPTQSRIRCQVKKSQGARTMGRRPEIQLTPIDVRLPDGTILPFQGAIIRMGADPIRDSTIAGEAGKGAGIAPIMNGGMMGAFMGMISGSGKGILYGAAAGAALPTIGTVLQRGSEIDLPPNTMFEARLEKPLKIPPQSVIVQNSPAAISTNRTDAANANALMGEPQLTTKIGPVSKHPQMEQPIEVTSDSNPESDIIPPQEATIKSNPVLKRPESAPTIKETSISKLESTATTFRSVLREEPTPIESAGEGFNISVKVKMVQVDAIARDRSGRIMPILGVKDFKVYDNNVLQELAGFSQDRIPLAVAIVADRSGSMVPYIAQLRWIASRALQNLKPQDEICIFSFAEDVQLLEPLTTDRERITYAIDRFAGGGSTDILDALYTATGYLAKTARNSRHAVILISDNQQTVRSKAGEQDIIKIAQEKDVVVYSLKTGSTLPSPFPASANPLQSFFMFPGDPVSKVAHDSGGEVINVINVESLDGALNTVITRLRTSYSLSYYPSNGQSGTFHAITVKLADKFGKSGSDYTIQAKKGYYAVQSPSTSVADAKP
jgi:VWFA-related protein